jgi:alkyl hydroperoxide reductase subunit F
MYDLIIVGGGPAGLTAAIYAIRKRLNVLLVTEDLGGKTNHHMEMPDLEHHQLIQGVEIVGKFRSELEYLKFARHMEPVESILHKGDHFIVQTVGEGELTARAVLIATGARQQRLGVPGEARYTGRGLGYSAMSYAPLFLDKRAVVVGEGDLALRSAAELAIVAEHVHLVGAGETIMATPLGKKLTSAQNVTVLPDYAVTRVDGNGYLEKLVLANPQGEELEIETDGAFIERVLIPNSELVRGLVDLDDQARIIVDSRGCTSLPGLFAAGDVTTTTEQVLVAVGEGAKAALSAYEYLLPTL